MSFPSNRSTNAFPQNIKNKDPRFAGIHRNMVEDGQQQQRRLPHSLSRSRSTGSSLAYNSANVTTRRLSSGSACEVCRKRKTKCDGGNPCAFCAANGVECIRRATRRKKSSLMIESNNTTTANNNKSNNSSGSLSINTVDTTTVTTNMFNSNNSNDINENTINGGAVGIATPPTITLNNASSGDSDDIDAPNNNNSNKDNNILSDAPSWVSNLKDLGRNNLSKQTSCPSLIATTQWSSATSSPTSSIPTNKNDPSPEEKEEYKSSVMTGYSPRSDRRSIIHGGKKEIPSMMDQLSCRTFSAAAFVDHRTNYPIYPLSSSCSTTNDRSDTNTSISPLSTTTTTSTTTFSSVNYQ